MIEGGNISSCCKVESENFSIWFRDPFKNYFMRVYDKLVTLSLAYDSLVFEINM